MLFEKEKYYELSEEIRNKIVKYYIIYIIIFTILGITISSILNITKESIILKLLVIFVFMLIGLLIASEKTIKIQIQEQEMKWKIEIYDILKKLEKK